MEPGILSLSLSLPLPPHCHHICCSIWVLSAASSHLAILLLSLALGQRRHECVWADGLSKRSEAICDESSRALSCTSSRQSARVHKEIDSKLQSYVDVALIIHIMARKGGLHAVLVASLMSMVCAELAQTYPMSEVVAWEIDSQMQLSVTSDGDLLPILYAVIPLTADLGLNESQTDRGVSVPP